jgi:hypothetical protein
MRNPTEFDVSHPPGVETEVREPWKLTQGRGDAEAMLLLFRAVRIVSPQGIDCVDERAGEVALFHKALGMRQGQSGRRVPRTDCHPNSDTRTERWRHERPKVAALGGPRPKPIFTNVGDPVASGVAVASGLVYFTTVASGKLVIVDAATGKVLKEITLGPVGSGLSVSRGRVYVGTGNTLFSPSDDEAFFPKKATGVLYSFGLPGEDEVSRLGGGKE